jgi:PAS domain S-box-containing protein
VSQSWSSWLSPRDAQRYAVATLAIAVATGTSSVVTHYLQIDPYTSLFLCAIMFAAWYGGLGPGLSAVVLSILAFAYFFIPPTHSLVMSAEDTLRLLFFAIAALFVVWISATQRRTAESLRRARDDLRATVSDLETANKSLQNENAERKRAEQIARNAERELQVTVDTIPAIAARYDSDGRLEFVNQTWRTFTGLTQASVQGQRWGVGIHPDDLPLVERTWRSHLSTGQPFDMEHRVRGADGEYRWFFVRRVPLRDENGVVSKWYAVAHDIDDQKRTERALRRSEAYLAEAQRLSQTGSFSWKIIGGGHHWSKQTYFIMGIDPTAKPTVDLVMERAHPDDRMFIQENLDRAFRGERDYDFEHRLLMPDGTVKYVRVRAHRHEYEAGEAEVVGALMDITAEKKAREALQNTQAELAHITRVTTLGEMSASIAHEVNQPLAAIVSNAEATLRWIDREEPDLVEARTAASQIIRSAQRANEVIRRIRDFAKKADPQKTEADINEVVEEAVTLVEHQALRHGVIVQSKFAPDLRPVLGDRIQLQQVIVNLAVNGMEAMAAVSDRKRVLIVRTQQHQPDRALVAVEDAGIGIEPEKLGRVFNAFHTTKPHGLGMGLSICRSIIEAHGGQLWASPNAGHGMTFQFTIPICAEGR